MVQIEKGIPLPPNATLKRTPKYPFESMEPGDSILIEGIERSTAKSYTATAKNRLATAGIDNARFVIRPVPETDRSYRLWRVQ